MYMLWGVLKQTAASSGHFGQALLLPAVAAAECLDPVPCLSLFRVEGARAPRLGGFRLFVFGVSGLGLRVKGQGLRLEG